jgi:hypothetical protein
MQFSPLVWLIPMPSCNNGIYWTIIRATEECCNHFQKPKRRATRYGLLIQSKRSVTITWYMQFSPQVWLIPMPLRNDGIYWTIIRATSAGQGRSQALLDKAFAAALFSAMYLTNTAVSAAVCFRWLAWYMQTKRQLPWTW